MTGHGGAAGEVTSALVKVTGVVAVRGGATVLDGVDLEVGAGQVVAIVGPNGAGKSTLLALLAGDLAPDSGSVHVAGAVAHTVPAAQAARHRAVLLQESRLSFPFTVEDVVRMGRAPWRRSSRCDDDDTVVAEVMTTTETTRLAARLFPTLSGGEKARTSFARVLAQQPELLLLDEPTAALDIRHQESLLAEVRRLADDGMAVVVVLHDLSLAAAYADTLVLLDAGVVRAVGPAADVLTSALLSEVYRHPVEVVELPGTGELAVRPVRPARPAPRWRDPQQAEPHLPATAGLVDHPSQHVPATPSGGRG